jgi:hypothetical protein
MNWLIAHWGENKKHIFDAVTSSLQALGARCTWMSRHEMSERDGLLRAIRSGEFQYLLTWQRFYSMQEDISQALAESAIRTVFMDFGFSPHYGTVVFDANGDGASSELAASWRTGFTLRNVPTTLDGAHEPDRANRAESDGCGFTQWPGAPDVSNIPDHAFRERRQIRMPFVFLPLQRPADSTVRFDSSVHDFKTLVLAVFALCAPNMFLVVKTHPLDRDLELGVPDHVPDRLLVLRRGYNESSERLNDWLLTHAALVIGSNSNMLMRAVMFDRPVIALGRGWLTNSGALHEINGLANLTSLRVPIVDQGTRRRVIEACLRRQVSIDALSRPDVLVRALDAAGISLAVGEPA